MSQYSKKQPAGLFPLLGTEMWERYGFYVLQSLLALFLTMDMNLSDSETYSIVGTFTALAYISPVIGGIIADRLIGQKLAVLLGCYFLLGSYLFLSFFYGSLTSLYISLSGVATGTGLLKPNVSCLVGSLYKPGDPKRDGGYSIYYAGMAFGILIGTTLPFAILKAYGWGVTFASPVVALFFASLVFYFGARWFAIQDNNPITHSWRRVVIGIVTSVLFVISAFVLLDFPFVAFLFFIALAVVCMFTVILIALGEQPVQRGKTLSFLILCFVSVLFWTLYFQMFLSLTLFIHKCVQKSFLGLQFETTYYIAIQSIGLVVIGPMLSPVFRRFYIKKDAIDSWLKFLLSILFMVIAFGLIVLSIRMTSDNGLVYPLWLIVAYLCVSVAELLLSPVGLSMSTKLVRPKNVGLMTGIFFVSLGLGGYLAGALATVADVAKGAHFSAIKHIYMHAFTDYLLIAIGIFVLSFLLYFVLRRLNRYEFQ